MISMEFAERHWRGHRQIYLVGGFFVGLDIGIGVRLHNHIINRPDQYRTAAIAHYLAVNGTPKDFTIKLNLR